MTRSAGIWGLRLLAIVAAFAVWFSASFAKRERQSEKVIDATVTYNPARGVVILDPVQTVKVRLRGPDRLIRTLAPHVVDVVVEVESLDAGSIEIPIDESRVLRPEGVQVIAVDPNSLTLTLDYEREIEVPVTPRLVGEPAGGAVPLEPIARPARARISGPASLLTGLEGVTTSPISLDGHALTFQQTVSVVSPNPLVRIVAPAVVAVSVPMFVPALEEKDPPTP